MLSACCSKTTAWKAIKFMIFSYFIILIFIINDNLWESIFLFDVVIRWISSKKFRSLINCTLDFKFLGQTNFPRTNANAPPFLKLSNDKNVPVKCHFRCGKKSAIFLVSCLDSGNFLRALKVIVKNNHRLFYIHERVFAITNHRPKKSFIYLRNIL